MNAKIISAEYACLVTSLLCWSLLLGAARGLADERQRHGFESSESCFHIVNECRRNSSCHNIYKRVKKNCQFSDSICEISPKYFRDCAVDIDLLRSIAFFDVCECIGKGYDAKRYLKCSDIHNLIFANPCYDKGFDILEEERKANAVTMTAVTDDVTYKSTGIGGADMSSSLIDLFGAGTKKPVLSNAILYEKKEEKESVVENVELQSHSRKAKVTEEELLDFDQSLVIESNFPAFDLKLPLRDDVINPVVVTDAEVREAYEVKDKLNHDQALSEDNKVDKHKNNVDFGDEGYHNPEEDRQAAFVSRQNEIERDVARLVGAYSMQPEVVYTDENSGILKKIDPDFESEWKSDKKEEHNISIQKHILLHRDIKNAYQDDY